MIPGAPKKTEIPGPGFYEIKDSKTIPTFTFGLKHYPKFIKGLFRLNNPGVGTYNLRKDKDLDVPCFKMGKEERKNLLLNETSLKYNNGASRLKINIDELTSTTTPKWSLYKMDRFSKKPKSAYIKRLNVPGPGTYRAKTFMGEGPKYTFPKEKNNHSDAEDEYMSKKTRKYPGPTTYHKKSYYVPSGPFISMSKLKRLEVGSDKFLLTTPGPNTYNPDKKYLSTWVIYPAWNWHNQGTTKSKSNSSKKEKVSPGPGEYNYNNEIGLGPKYTFRKKLKKSKKADFPGPGSYNINTVVFNGPAYTMGKREKEKPVDNKKDNMPLKTETSGSKENRGFSFPKAEINNKAKFIFPGPGQYRIPTSFDYISNLTREKGMFDPTYRYV